MTKPKPFLRIGNLYKTRTSCILVKHGSYATDTVYNNLGKAINILNWNSYYTAGNQILVYLGKNDLYYLCHKDILSRREELVDAMEKFLFLHHGEKVIIVYSGKTPKNLLDEI
jgi:hypothetical protein